MTVSGSIRLVVPSRFLRRKRKDLAEARSRSFK